MSENEGNTSLFIAKRQKVVKKLLEKGLSCVKIAKKLETICGGKYKAGKSTVQRDIAEINKQNERWEKIHKPHKMEIVEKQRQDVINHLDHLIHLAESGKQYKTAGDLIAKKARLLGIDKYEAPKPKKKDDIDEKFKNKGIDEVNEALFSEFKELGASIMRLVQKKKFSNVVGLTIRIVRADKTGKKTKYFVTRFGDELDTYRAQEEMKTGVKGEKKQEKGDKASNSECSGGEPKDLIDM